MSLVLHDDHIDYELDDDELIVFMNVTLEPHSTATAIIMAEFEMKVSVFLKQSQVPLIRHEELHVIF